MEETKTVYDAVPDYRTQSQQGQKETALPKLSFCILMDLAGLATYALPALGEWGDMLWAPISGLIFMKTFGGMTGVIGGIANMAEELIPFTDFIPTFTIGYFYTKYQLNRASKK